MSEGTFMVDAFASASAGIVSRILTHPLDTAKARLQAPGFQSEAPYKGTIDVLRRTVKLEGPAALYRGFGAIIVGGTPGTMAYLCGYEFIKNKLIQSRSDKDGSTNIPEFAAYFVAGMLAETFACIIYVPVDVIKERLQVQRTNVQSGVEQKYLYNGSFDALKTIMKQEGLQGIYKGYSATLASYGPYSALYFLFYERMKGFSSWYVQRNTIEESRTGAELPFLHTVACSATAGAISSFLTSPLDMAKLRLQIQRGNHVVGGGGDQPLSGMMDCLSKIYKDGGVKGLFRGAGARVAHFVPATTIMMTCYEEFRSIFNKF